MPTARWEVELYRRADGRCPTLDLLADLPAGDRVRALNKLALLEEHGHTLRRPHVDYLQDDIWELRVSGQAGPLRLLYFFFDGTKIVVTHGFVKKGNVRDKDRVPQGEMARAGQTRAEYLARQQGGKR